MKKFKLGLMSLALVLGFAAAFASSPKAHKTSTAALYWYAVDASGKTMGSPAYHDEKVNVIAAQPCDDTPARPICYFGSTVSTLPSGTSVGSPAAANRILESL